MTLAMLSVIHPDTLFISIAGGVIAGAVVIGWITANPVYASGIASSIRYGVAVGLAAIFTTIVFWSGQIIEAGLSNDPTFNRLVGRFLLNIVYCIGLGVGTALGQRLYSGWRDRDR